MKQYIEKLKNKQNLSFDESKTVFQLLMNGKADDKEIFDFLTLLSAKGEVADEIAGGVFVLRNKSKRVNVDNCVDTCGTGGDGRLLLGGAGPARRSGSGSGSLVCCGSHMGVVPWEHGIDGLATSRIVLLFTRCGRRAGPHAARAPERWMDGGSDT